MFKVLIHVPLMLGLYHCVLEIPVFIIYPMTHAHVHALLYYGPLARYIKVRVAHAPWIPGTFSPTPQVIDLDMHHDTCVTHVPWCMSGSITRGFLWSRRRGICSRHSQRMRNPHSSVSGKRHMGWSDAGRYYHIRQGQFMETEVITRLPQYQSPWSTWLIIWYNSIRWLM